MDPKAKNTDPLKVQDNQNETNAFFQDDPMGSFRIPRSFNQPNLGVRCSRRAGGEWTPLAGTDGRNRPRFPQLPVVP